MSNKRARIEDRVNFLKEEKFNKPYNVGFNLDPNNGEEEYFDIDTKRAITMVETALCTCKIDVSIAVFTILKILSLKFVFNTSENKFFVKTIGFKDKNTGNVSYVLEEINESTIKNILGLNDGISNNKLESVPTEPMTDNMIYDVDLVTDLGLNRIKFGLAIEVMEYFKDSENYYYPTGRCGYTYSEWEEIFIRCHLKSNYKESTKSIDILGFFRSSTLGYRVNNLIYEPHGALDQCEIVDGLDEWSGAFNQFTGFHPESFEPRRDEIDDLGLKVGWRNDKNIMKILFHIYVVWCDSYVPLFQYVLSWFTISLFAPNTKLSKHLVIFGQQGCGKSLPTRVLLKLFSDKNSFFANSAEDVLGHFNHHLNGRLFVAVDELSPKYLERERFKSLLTGREMVITQKYKGKKKEINRLRFICCTTSNKIQKGQSCVQLLVCSPVAVGQTNYFKNLHNSIENFDVKLFTRMLFDVSLDNFGNGGVEISNPSINAYSTTSNVIRSNRNDNQDDSVSLYINKFLMSCILDGGILRDENNNYHWPSRLPISKITERFNQWISDTYPSSNEVNGELVASEKSPQRLVCENIITSNNLITYIYQAGGFKYLYTTSGNRSSISLSSNEYQFVYEFLNKNISLFTPKQIDTLCERYLSLGISEPNELISHLTLTKQKRVNPFEEIDTHVFEVIEHIHKSFLRTNGDSTYFKGWGDEVDPILNVEVPGTMLLNDPFIKTHREFLSSQIN
ncbi:hypothetical protein DDB_G0284191 [Dictyostelium discoideum AX4]|uniref:NrS-1 polymerase-like helicase domain-containing protein n=1 Tax=Dictyostelium discoideum TaxID=44689 RepID=Q54Q10_DICDI|nr:hypothetical protein DDB_G0284191 [Dictyostelium discoideum AX4]EAL65284.1 hypothetical protein DDB_G0284191 [Dictyostelium discoideum AX4]|eukprot:XP_638635.1 hypothetical protein DDB_G0284191 [Dictyostelium discoideum AX4]